MEQTINLSLGLQEVNAILEALGALPYTKSAPLIESIKAQAIPQLQAAATEVAQDAVEDSDK